MTESRQKLTSARQKFSSNNQEIEDRNHQSVPSNNQNLDDPMSGQSLQKLTFEAPQPAILALDLGTVTGWAVRSPAGQISSGTLNFKPKRFEGGGMRYLRFSDALRDLHAQYAFDRILFEEVRRHAGTDAAHIYGGFMAHLTAWAEFHAIPYESVPVGTWKKAVVGKGNAGKPEVIKAMMALGYSPADDNEADALGVLTWFSLQPIFQRPL